MTSSILERVKRINTAMVLLATVTVGNIQCMGECQPDVGSHPRFNPNSMASIMASQKLGMDTPTKPTNWTTLSNIEYCLVALMMPKGTPTKTDNSIPIPANCIVVAKRSPISWVTGLRVLHELPKSKRTAPRV
jgi:hypothetical protein